MPDNHSPSSSCSTEIGPVRTLSQQNVALAPMSSLGPHLGSLLCEWQEG